MYLENNFFYICLWNSVSETAFYDMLPKILGNWTRQETGKHTKLKEVLLFYPFVLFHFYKLCDHLYRKYKGMYF